MTNENREFSFRLSNATYDSFVKDGFADSLNDELLAHLKSMGLNARLLPPSQKGGAFDLSLLMRLIGYLTKLVKHFSKLLSWTAARNIAHTAPAILLDIYNFRDTPDFNQHDRRPGEAQADLLYVSLIVHDWLKLKLPRYNLHVTSRVIYHSYDYSIACHFTKTPFTEQSLGLFIRFVKGAKLKSHVHEQVGYENNFFINHKKYVSNIDGKLIKTVAYRYLKLDTLYNGSFWSRGLSAVELSKGFKVYRVKPRLRDTVL